MMLIHSLKDARGIVKVVIGRQGKVLKGFEEDNKIIVEVINHKGKPLNLGSLGRVFHEIIVHPLPRYSNIPTGHVLVQLIFKKQ